MLNPIKAPKKCGAYKLDKEDRMAQCGKYKSLLFVKKEVAYD
jgi:hypothetical protein